MKTSKDNSTEKKSWGGARANSGRPKGQKDQITIHGLLTQIKSQSRGRDYEEILVEDFMQARSRNDTGLMLKYHHLILNKVMNSLAKIEVTDSEDAIEAKKQAFAEALARLTGISPDSKEG